MSDYTVSLQPRNPNGRHRHVRVIGTDWDGSLEAAEMANPGWDAIVAGPYVEGTGISFQSTIYV